VLAFSDIIDFLLGLLRDDAARAQFERDPQKALADAGMQGVSAQDIRDARLQLADSGAVCAVDDGTHSSYPHGHDPVREIGYTTAHYAAADDTADHDPAGDDARSADPVAQNNTFLTIDDRDTLFFQSISDDDITVTDNSVSVTDSFNQDNSTVTAIQANGSFNSDDDTTIDAQNSFNSDDDVVAIQDNDVNGGGDPIVVDTAASTTGDAVTPAPLPADVAPEADPVEDLPPDDVPADDTTDDVADGVPA
jgi:hypothetical protein